MYKQIVPRRMIPWSLLTMLANYVKLISLVSVMVVLPAFPQVEGNLRQQKAILYDDINFAGANSLVLNGNIEDLSTVNFDDRARYICATGTWILYTNINFDGGDESPPGVDFVFGDANDCTKIRFQVAAQVSSIRFAGNPEDYKYDSLTLYEGVYFQDMEEYIADDKANLDLDALSQSVILTGTCPWTVCDESGFSGACCCLYPPNPPNNPAFFPDLASVNITVDSIRSVRKGCHDAN